MAHVLIPTDFSDNALNAAIYAVRLFGEEGNTFTLLHAYRMPHGTAGAMWNVAEMLAHDAKEDLGEFHKQLLNALPDMKPEFELCCEHGDLPNVVNRFKADPVPPDLVVMGTQGASGLKETLFGSNTASVIKTQGLPVLAVPEKAIYRSPKRILLADDGGPTDKPALKVLMDIARWSHSEVMIVRVVNEEVGTEDTGTSTALDDVLGAIPRSHHYLSGDNVEKALNDMADQNDVDLVVVMHRQRGLFDQFFKPSISTKWVMHTHIPMLVLVQSAR